MFSKNKISNRYNQFCKNNFILLCVYIRVHGGTHICEQVHTHMNGGQRTTSGATPPLRQAWLSPIRLDCLARESRKCCQHWDYKYIPLYSGD